MAQHTQHELDHSPNRSQVFWGIIAILGGALIVVSRFTEIDNVIPWFALLLGLAMLVYGMVMRTPSGLIPGGIVSGVGLGLTLVGPFGLDSGEEGGGLFLLCLALGFLSIPLTTRLFTDEMHWWGFIPGSIIALVGLATLFGGAFLQALDLLQLGGALALVGLGVWLIYRFMRRNP